MPQLSPMSWVVVPSFVFLCLFCVLVGFWWMNFSFFEFKSKKKSEMETCKGFKSFVNIWKW